MNIIFVFIDGVGLGPGEPHNPFYTARTPYLSQLLEGNSLTIESCSCGYQNASLLALDATLGVGGLPQSATGQASLFTGVNAAELLGYHLSGFPNQKLRKILAEQGMFLQLQRKYLSGTFANAYRPEFFADLVEGTKKHFSCSTLITYYAGLEFRNLRDLRQGQAVYMDITNEVLADMGFDVSPVTAWEAGKRLVRIAELFDLTLYEHFLTDVAGHSGDYKIAIKTVEMLDAFLGGIVENLDLEKGLLLITSDHGNLEDLTVKRHTLNPVPALIVGKNRGCLVPLLQKKKDITGVLPAFIAYLSLFSVTNFTAGQGPGEKDRPAPSSRCF